MRTPLFRGSLSRCRPQTSRNLQRLITLIAVSFAIAASPLFGEEGSADRFQIPTDEIPTRGMWSERPAQRWQEALVTGNGTLGAMVFGTPAVERVVLNHERLYEPLLDQPCPVPDIADSLPEVRRLLANGKYKEAYAYAYQAAIDAGFPGIQWTAPYHPACSLVIEQDGIDEEAILRYRRSTNFQTGEIIVRFQSGGREFVRKTFASRADGVIVMKISAVDGEPISGRVKLVNQDSRHANKRVDEKGGGYHDPEIATTPHSIAYRCKYNRSPRGYQTFLQFRSPAIDPTSPTNDAKPGSQPQDAVAFDASEVTLFIAIDSLETFDADGGSLQSLKDRLAKIEGDYDALLSRHVAIHQPMFDRVQFQLTVDDVSGDPGQLLSSENLIALQKTLPGERIQLTLLQKMFDMGRYTLISSSGEWPPNLMGIWNGDWRPEWSGDFTLDANVNLQIAAANLGQLPEAIASYDRLVLGLVDDWKTNATNLYGCRGVLSGCRTDGRHNLHTHFSDGFPGHAWTAGAEWMVLPMWEHHQTTGDDQYLQERLLPVMKQITLFYADFLDGQFVDGKRVFWPSYSPENRPSNTNCPVAINATMDIACAKEALQNLIGLGDRSGLSKAQLADYQRLLDELPPYLINQEGALKEWASPLLDDRYDHRHVSHLYPVWPGHEINPEDTPDLFQAAIVAAQKRGRGNGSAHGLTHMALIAARLKDADLVKGNLRFMLSKGYLLPSLFTFHNPGRIYNSDMLNALPAVVMEMLVYSKPGEIELLPALSDELESGQISGVGCRNQTVVESLSWDLKNGKVTLQLFSSVDQPMTLRLRRGIASVVDSTDDLVQLSSDGTIKVSLKAGQSNAWTFQLSK
ncbi:Glycosyl hydrolase family 65, N-terminal domain [Neorhodopirellula lusitana]|uniref:Glycosyl hydrolase family 65, N-terminal domain n=1 Tax=Neorhodopirellula lusitana TaxID=445327 RepID=A0ABY1Q1E4_9BACT|nr:glycoside hydrolase N-terminal domain-containing protein [Neorhodopirellula lusitana]SMP56175.1 Glycosyl hydrolase family 65, N-terminal domain [Neorhodopirellula lusitana]